MEITKILEFILLSLILITKVSSSEEIWDFKNTAIDLFSNSNSYTYIITKGNVNNSEFRLEKKITKEGNNIIQKNFLYIDKHFTKEVNWEDIDNFYNINGVKYICPTGRNYMNVLYNSELKEIIPKSIASDKNWELKCYYLQENSILTFFLYDDINTDIKIYKYNLDIDNLEGKEIKMKDENANDVTALFAFRWIIDNSDINEESLIAITSSSSSLDIKYFQFEGDILDNKERDTITQSLFNNKVNHDINRNYFYFISYNSNSFKSGYINETDKITKSNFYIIQKFENKYDIFNSFGISININTLNLTKNSKYAYYNVTKGEINFYGMIDIELNRI